MAADRCPLSRSRCTDFAGGVSSGVEPSRERTIGGHRIECRDYTMGLTRVLIWDPRLSLGFANLHQVQYATVLQK